MQGLSDAIDLGLSDPVGFIVASLQELYLHSALVGVETQWEYVWSASRITILKTVIPLDMDIEDSSFRRTRSASGVTNLSKKHRLKLKEKNVAVTYRLDQCPIMYFVRSDLVGVLQ